MSEIDDWKAAEQLCIQCAHLPIKQATALIKAKAKNPNTASKAIKLLTGMHLELDYLETSQQKVQQLSNQLIEFPVGTIFHGFELEEKIGHGGMSVVYRAKRIDQDIQSQVAIKIMSPLVSCHQPDIFAHELKALSKLDHPNVVSFHYGKQTEEAYNFLVMDYLAGASDLEAFSSKENLSKNSIIELIKQTSLGLSHAHQKAIIHKDIKPKNILVTPHKVVKIIDFGIATSTQNETHDHSYFTQQYASPEQMAGKALDVRTDVFSLGKTLLTLLTQLQQRSQSAQNQSLTENQLGDMDLKNIVSKATAISRNDRYQNMAELTSDLSAYLEKKPVKASPSTPVYRLKKTIQRNPFSAFFAFLALTSLLISAVLVINFALDAEYEAKKAKDSLNYFTSIFDHLDPNTPFTGEANLLSILKQTSNKVAADKNTDQDIIYSSHLEFGKIFYKLNLFHESLVEYQRALSAYQTLYNQADETSISLAIKIMRIEATIGNVNKALEMAPAIQKDVDEVNSLSKDILADFYNQLMNIYNLSYDSVTVNRTQSHQYKRLLLDLLSTHQMIDQQLAVEIFTSLAVRLQRDKETLLAEQYFSQALQISDSINEPTSIEHLGILHDYAIAKYRQQDLSSAERILQDIINTLDAHDKNNYFIGTTLETLSTILIYQGKTEASIQALDDAISNFSEHNNLIGTYMAQSKRAKYSALLFDFQTAVEDQIDVIFQSSSKEDLNNKKNIASLSLLAEWLSVNGHPEHGYALFDYIIGILNKESRWSELKQVESEYTLTAVYLNDVVKAKSLIKNASNSANMYMQIAQLLLHQKQPYLSPDLTFTLPDPKVLRLDNSLLYLLIAERMNIEPTAKQLKLFCEIQTLKKLQAYGSVIRLSLKSPYLDACQKYRPDEFINSAKAKISHLPISLNESSSQKLNHILDQLSKTGDNLNQL